MLLISLSFCVVLLCVFTFVLSSVLWCLLRFPHKNDIRFVLASSCFSQVWCLSYVISVYFCVYWCSAHTVVCFVFLRLVYPMLPISLNCPFLIAPSAFSNVYFVSIKIPTVRWKSRTPTNVLQIKYSIILMISFRVHIFLLVAGKGTQQRYFLSGSCSTILTYWSLLSVHTSFLAAFEMIEFLIKPWNHNLNIILFRQE